MGELDIVYICPDPGQTGYQLAFLTVFFTWAPLALVGLGLKQGGALHATMRGAGTLRVLARLAIAIQVAALTFSLMFALMFLAAFRDGFVSMAELYATVAFGLTIFAGGITLSAFGIRAWHLILTDLSHRGESRLLV